MTERAAKIDLSVEERVRCLEGKYVSLDFAACIDRGEIKKCKGRLGELEGAVRRMVVLEARIRELEKRLPYMEDDKK